MHLQKAFMKVTNKATHLPVVERICKEVVALPMYPELTLEDHEYIIGSINKYIGMHL